MTMIIDRNAKSYDAYLQVEKLLKSYSVEDHKHITEIINNTAWLRSTNTRIEDHSKFTTVNGLDIQIQSLTAPTGMIFYAKYDKIDKNLSIQKLVVQAKEVEDD